MSPEVSDLAVPPSGYTCTTVLTFICVVTRALSLLLNFVLRLAFSGGSPSSFWSSLDDMPLLHGANGCAIRLYNSVVQFGYTIRPQAGM